MKPLRGTIVLDMSRSLAGPLCAQMLADLGAEVVKVEALGLGDETRGWPPFKATGLGATYLTCNRNKRSIAIDLKTPQGLELVHALARRADVAIESFSTGVAERLGVDAQALQAINPRLVHCTISGFGRHGPLQQQPGYDVILQAFCGIMALTGEQGGGHVRSPVSPIDQMTGTHAVVGVMAALMERERTGRGGTVEASLFDTAVSLQRYNLQMLWTSGAEPAKCGSGHESLCPYQAFEAADGPIMIGVANDSLWRKFCRIAGLDDIVDDPRYSTNANRAARRADVVTLVQAAIATRPASFWYEQLSEVGVPCSPIHTLQQLMDHPHTAASGVVVDYAHPVAGPNKAVVQPFILDGMSREVGSAPPVHAQHSEELLLELGLSRAQIEALREGKIVE